MLPSALSYGAIATIASFYEPHSTPLAFSSAAPAARIAGEVTVFARFPHKSDKQLPRRGMLGLDPLDNQRVAAIADMEQFERAVWWLTRGRSAADRRPFPLRSVHFSLDSSVESPVDVVARVPLCAATVTSLDLNTRCDTCNHISSLRAISQLVGLRELLMQHTTVSPSGPPLPVHMTEDLHTVFRNLRKLVVGDYYLVQQLPLNDLHYLEEADLSGTGVNSEVVGAISGCHRVHSLKLRGCMRIDSFAPLGALTRLTCLDLSFTRIRDDELRHLCRCCTQLTSVRLDRCDALHDFAPLGGLTELRCLHAGRTAIRNADLERVCGLPWLTQLHLESCRLLDVFTPFAGLQELHSLDAQDTWLGDEGVAALARCAKLVRLNLSNCTAVTTFAPLAELAQLEHLSLSRTRLSDACLGALCTSALPLRTLLLNGCRLVHNFTPLCRLRCIEELGVCDTSFNDVALQAVSQCGQLARLHLHICVAVTTLAPLVQCVCLRYLGIGGTRFSRQSCEGDCVALRERGVQLNHQLFLVSAF